MASRLKKKIDVYTSRAETQTMPYVKDGIGQTPRWIELTTEFERKDADCIQLYRLLKPQFPSLGVQKVPGGCQVRVAASQEAKVLRILEGYGI